MAIDPQSLLNRNFDPVARGYSERDAILYALAVGVGADPLDDGALRYVCEGAQRGFQALPTFLNVLGYTGFWADQADTGINWRRLVHAEQSITLARPLAAAGHVIGHNRVTALLDKGVEKGALMVQERRVIDAATGDLLATVRQTVMLRGDGGFGGSHGAALQAPHRCPDRAPDAACDLVTLPQAALIYRLTGDFNPLHADPKVAQTAGFPRPILHGLCTMGVALHAVLRALLDYESSAVRGMRVRFTAPVFPGDTLRTHLWRDGTVVSLRTTAVERSAVVLDAGRVDLAD